MWLKNSDASRSVAPSRALRWRPFFVSVTGVSSPSVDAKIVNLPRLSPNIKRIPIFGLGYVASAEREQAGPETVDTRSTFYPGTEDVMGWIFRNSVFTLFFHRQYRTSAKHLGSDVDAFLGDNGLRREDIASWIMRTGGPRVLEATREAFGGRPEVLRISWDCLRRIGNLSTASVLCVLEEVMQKKRAPSGAYSLLAAAGPGFCFGLVLLQWP
jgi:alkylresorcinol/alkylpyrone synthase